MSFSALHIEFIVLMLSIGGIGGFLSGLLGVGGGLIFVPALYSVLISFALDAAHALRMAIGTSTMLVLANTLSSTFWHHKKKAIDFSIIRNWWLSIVLGVILGTLFASSVNAIFLKKFFAAITLLMSFYIMFSHEET